MTDQVAIASAVRNLSQADDNVLLARLGTYSAKFREDPARFAVPGAVVAGAEATAGPMMDAAIALGTRVLNRWSKVLYSLVCGGDDSDAEVKDVRESILGALKLNSPEAIATAVTAALISVFSVGPTIATIVGVLLGKLLLPAAGKEICAFWKEKLPA
jgi:hypothetical protein